MSIATPGTSNGATSAEGTDAGTTTEAQHGLTEHSHGGWPTIPVQTRSERFTSTRVDEFPPVTGREAAWKYTPVRQLSALIDGPLDGSQYPFELSVVAPNGTAMDAGAAGVSAEWVERSDARIGSAGLPEDRASAGAWTAFERALLLRVTGEEPVEITLSRSALGEHARAAHTIVEIGPNARGLIVLDNSGPALLTENVEIIVGAGADVTLVTVQEWDAAARHLAAHFARLGRDARLKHAVVSLGGEIVRVNPSAHLAGEGSDVDMLGVYFSDAGQHLEQQVYVFHDAPHTRSRVEYKGALQGQGAHSVWIGDVLIGNKAVGTDSYEQNRNLVLTEGTRADSVPNLEIETGDIVGAGHASATGRFDDEQLFYLQSRGITEEEARRLVVRGFLAGVVQRIGSHELVERLTSAIEAELAVTAV